MIDELHDALASFVSRVTRDIDGILVARGMTRMQKRERLRPIDEMATQLDTAAPANRLDIARIMLDAAWAIKDYRREDRRELCDDFWRVPDERTCARVIVRAWMHGAWGSRVKPSPWKKFRHLFLTAKRFK